jgi:hypothetical protein
MFPRRLLAGSLAIALLGAACSASGGATSPAPSPASSGSGSAEACATTPAPAAGAIEAWSPTSQDPSVFPQIINPGGTLACGPARFLFSFLDEANTPIASPDRTVSVGFFDLGADPETAVDTVDADFIWAIEDEVGVYVAYTDFPTSGLWGAEFRTEVPGATPETIRVQFEVQPESIVVDVGDPAPASDTPTLADVGGDVSKISTDDDPVEAFYETSVADALAGGRPFVLAFATPKFCTSAQCGPTLDRLKPIAAAHPGMTFINVEPFELESVDGQLQPVLTGDPATLTPAAATSDWGLPVEPWVFVVDGDGIVTGSFVLIVGDEELDAAISAVE